MSDNPAVKRPTTIVVTATTPLDEFDEDKTENSARLAARADDAIPVEAICLSEAFARVHEAAEENPEILHAIPEWAEDNVEMTIQTLREKEKSWASEDRTTEVHIKAACLFRIALFESLQAYVRDPDYNQILKLNPEGWFFCDERVPIQFEDWLSNSETPGPIEGTIIHKERRPVFLLNDEFEKWLSETFKLGLKSRKKRTGSYEIADAPLVEQMHALIQSGKAKSASEAASQCVGQARGAGIDESKKPRLRKAYYDRHPG